MITQESQFDTNNAEFWGEIFEDVACYYVESNHSVHFLDVDTLFPVDAARICKSRDHAVEIYNSYVNWKPETSVKI
jgi:hypothetical protein